VFALFLQRSPNTKDFFAAWVLTLLLASTKHEGQSGHDQGANAVVILKIFSLVVFTFTIMSRQASTFVEFLITCRRSIFEFFFLVV
jgi:hypothetical protein